MINTNRKGELWLRKLGGWFTFPTAHLTGTAKEVFYKCRLFITCLLNLVVLLSFLSLKKNHSIKLSEPSNFCQQPHQSFFPTFTFEHTQNPAFSVPSARVISNTAWVNSLEWHWEHYSLRNQQFNHISLVKLQWLGHRQSYFLTCINNFLHIHSW